MHGTFSQRFVACHVRRTLTKYDKHREEWSGVGGDGLKKIKGLDSSSFRNQIQLISKQ